MTLGGAPGILPGMRTLVLLAAFLAFPPDLPIAITATDTGINGGSMSATLVSNGINMTATRQTNQLALTLLVTPGSTTRVQVYCDESTDKAKWSQINTCDSAGACTLDKRTYTLSGYATVGGTKAIASRWAPRRTWVRCTVDDPDDGTGTVILTGERTWQ